MSRPHNLIFIKKCQFVLVFITLTCLLNTAKGVAVTKTDREKFTCGYKLIAEYINSLITMDRHLTVNYIERFKSSKISKEELVHMITILMRYRLFPINNGKCQFLSYLCISPSQDTDPIYELALQAVKTQPSSLGFCHIISNGRRRKFSLFSDICRDAIEKRIRAIPPPLAVAQAGLESGWGTSNFAKKGKNLFGMQVMLSSSTTRGHPKCLPVRGDPKRCVLKYNSIETNYFTYSQTLNSMRAYLKLREHRYQSELRNERICNMSLKMATGLHHYAEDPHYISKVQGTIRIICNILDNC